MATEPQAGTAAEEELRALLEALPPELATHVFTHASWTTKRSDSYERLAFLGDSVLSLAITSYLYPSLAADRYGAGELTKVRAQTVSGRACRVVAERLDVPRRLREAAPPAAAGSIDNLVSTERVLASICEAVIGACYLAFGYDRVAEAVVAAFTPELTEALEHPLDFKSALQERLARRGASIAYMVVREEGPPHERTFTIAAEVDGVQVAQGSGRSKKDAEQAAAQAATEQLFTPSED